jgi:hypothetical protein
MTLFKAGGTKQKAPANRGFSGIGPVGRPVIFFI